MLGIAALCYALGHLVLYFFDQNWDLWRVASEIALRIYLTIGFVALLGLVVLGATSTDRAIRKLGSNWNRLHRIVYGLGIFAALHFFMQSKADVYQPTLMAGFFMLLMFYRMAHWRGLSLTSPLVLVAIAVATALATVVDRGGLVRLGHRRAGRPRARRQSAVLLFDPSGMVGAGNRPWSCAGRLCPLDEQACWAAGQAGGKCCRLSLVKASSPALLGVGCGAVPRRYETVRQQLLGNL